MAEEANASPAGVAWGDAALGEPRDARGLGTYRALRAALLFALVLGAAAMAAYSLRWVLLATALGIGLGVLLVPWVDGLHRRLGRGRGLAVAACALVVVATAVGFLFLLGSLFAGHLGPMIEKLPGVLELAKARLAALVGDRAWLNDEVWSRFNVGEVARNSLSTVMQGAQLSFRAVAGAIVVLSLAFYTAAAPRDYVDGVLSLFPAYRRPTVRRMLEQSARAFRGWFVAQLISLTLVGGVTALGLWLIGIDAWLLLGVVTAVCELIPYLGPILAGTLTVLITLGTEPDKAVWVLAFFLALQQVESNLVTPIVMRRSIELPPVHLIVVMLALGQWFGVLGVLLAAPFLAVARALCVHWYVPRMDRRTRPPRLTIFPSPSRESSDPPRREQPMPG
jgi:predicted PurR-regulated permease PerM